MQSAALKQDKSRLNREDWLTQALELLGETGDPNAIRIDALCKRLGVTKGSFYWHFKGRDDLIDGVIDFWSVAYHKQIHSGFDASPSGDPHAFLAEILGFWGTGHFASTDAVLRQWAKTDQRVADAIASADRLVAAQFEAMFVALGFAKTQAQARSVMMLAFGVAAPHITHLTDDMPMDEALALLLQPN